MNLINNSYKNIIVRTIDADALALLISYIGKVELNDRNSCISHNLGQVLQHQTDHTRTWF